MTEPEEAVLFEQGPVRVTTRRFVVEDRALSYPLCEIRSAELGHRWPGHLEWTMGPLLLGLCVAAAGLGSFAFPGASDRAARWLLVRGLVIAAVGALLYLAVNGLPGRCFVRAESTSSESWILFESHDCNLVKAIVNAINQAVAAEAPGEPASRPGP